MLTQNKKMQNIQNHSVHTSVEQSKKLINFDLQFINETVRLANIVPGIFRKAVREINFKGK